MYPFSDPNLTASDAPQIDGVDANGAFIVNGGMGGADPIDASGKIEAGIEVGDDIFYDWDYSGDHRGNGFFANHAAIVVILNGTDPHSRWKGLLIDEHTTNRYHAIWNLVPYNSQAMTTDSWYDDIAHFDPWPWPGMARLHRDRYASQQAAQVSSSARKTVPQNSPSLLPTPDSPRQQLAYSAPRRIQGTASSRTTSRIEAAFQSAMNERQKMVVPSLPAGTSVAWRPSATELGRMYTAGQRLLPALFTGGQLTRELETLGTARNSEATWDIRVLGGGAGKFHYAFIRSDAPGRAEIRGTMTAWEKFAQVQADDRVVPATPANTLDYDATLALTGGTWKVASFDWTFAPGSQP